MFSSSVFTCSVCTSSVVLIRVFTSAHVAIVWLISGLAAAATDGHHPLSISVTVELYGHVYFLSVWDAASSGDD